jgi:hypothetical protein
MPTFRAPQAPRNTIATSFAKLLGSTSQATPLDEIGVELKAAELGKNNALAEKAMAEVQAMRDAQAARNDPSKMTQFAAFNAGVDVPTAEQFYHAARGMVADNPVANDDEGNALPVARYQPPENLTDPQRRGLNGAFATYLANILGTGKTNADQLAKAAGQFSENAVRSGAVGLPADQQNAQVGPYRASAREPFSGGANAQGIAIDQETGKPVIASQPLLDAAINQRETQAQLAEARAGTAEAQAEAARARAAGRGGGRGGAAQAKAPVGYRWTEDDGGNPILEPIPGGPKDTSQAGPGKPLPSSAAKGLFENQQNLRRAEQALALINGAEIKDAQGNVIAKGDKEATGFKGYVPDALLQRFDTTGNPTRAAIADLGSLVIHDRSGAAVTAAEFPRLQPFIPSAKDDPATVRTKLGRFVQEYRNVTGEMADFYSQSGYRVPSEALRSSGATPASAAAPASATRGTRGASGSWDGNERRQPQRGAAPAKRVVVDW